VSLTYGSLIVSKRKPRFRSKPDFSGKSIRMPIGTKGVMSTPMIMMQVVEEVGERRKERKPRRLLAQEVLGA